LRVSWFQSKGELSMSQEQVAGNLSEAEILAIYAPLAKAGKSWNEIMASFPGYKKETLAVRISNIRTKRQKNLLQQIEDKRNAGVTFTKEMIDKLEAKLVNEVVPNVQKRGRVKGEDNFGSEFASAFDALASLTGESETESA